MRREKIRECADIGSETKLRPLYSSSLFRENIQLHRMEIESINQVIASFILALLAAATYCHLLNNVIMEVFK